MNVPELKFVDATAGTFGIAIPVMEFADLVPLPHGAHVASDPTEIEELRARLAMAEGQVAQIDVLRNQLEILGATVRTLEARAGVETFVDPTDAEMKSATAAIRAILTEVFGPGSYVQLLRDVNEETGAPQVILEAHYGFAGGESDLDRLLMLHEQFVTRVAREAPETMRAPFLVLPVPAEAGPPDVSA